MKPLDLTKTSRALAAYDAAGDAFDVDPSPANMAALDAARLVVGESFADDTTDRNDRKDVTEFVQCLAGITFVRRMVAELGPTHYGPKATPGRHPSVRKALCGVVYQTGARNGHKSSSNVEHVTCVDCLEAELAAS
jgi:hypothetical protein